MLSVDSPLSGANRTDFTSATGTCPVVGGFFFRDVCLLNLTAVSYFTIYTICTKKKKKEIQSQHFPIYKFVL